MLFIYAVFLSRNLAATPAPDDRCTVTDEHANPVPEGLLQDAMPVRSDQAFKDRERALDIATQGVYDLPLAAVSRALYL